MAKGNFVRRASRARFNFLFAFSAIYVLTPLGTTASGAPPHRPGYVLVGFHEAAGPAEVRAFERSHGVHSARSSPFGVHLMTVPQGVPEENWVRTLERDERVRFAELDRLVEPGLVPNDPRFAEQWHLPKIRCPQAWNYVPAVGDQLIAICDSGIDSTHPDLSGRVRTDLGLNTVDGSTNTSPAMHHGTMVAGVAAAATNNAVGVAGVAWAAQILPIRITNQPDGGAYYWDAAEAIRYAAEQGARVINLSYRMAGSSTIDSAGNYARQLGSLTIVSAGNSGAYQAYPDLAGFLAISATTSSDVLSSSSSYGPFVDLAAPGVSLLTTYPGGIYANGSGTSFAAPCVAGVASLLWQISPSLSVDQVEQILLTSALDLGTPGQDDWFGWGRLDAEAAVLDAVAAGGSGGNLPPVVSILQPDPAQPQYTSEPVGCVGTANDSEDGDLAPALTWTSSLQGDLGTGAAISVILLPGTHDLIAAVTDSQGAVGQQQITLSVECQCPSDCSEPETAELPGLTCTDGLDNDCDGASDCDDADCAADAQCVPPPCNANGLCDAGEDCVGCPGDCVGTSPGGCGDGMCEPGNGEDCVSCPQDCNGVQSGNPNSRFCCGNGAGSNPVGCNDPRCTGSGFDCTDAVPFCCGDGVCNGPEDPVTCQLDCAVAYCSKTCFDLNDDTAIDLFDFALFAECFGLTENEINLASCNCADFNGDQRVNLFDFGMLANHFLVPSLTSQPPDCPLSP